MICRPKRPANSRDIDGCARMGQRLFVAQGLQQIEPNAHVRIGTSGVETDYIAFAEQGRQIACSASLAPAVRSNQHVGQPWVQWQGCHLPSVIGSPVIRVQSCKRVE